jgi:hypothetical protein
LKGTAGFGMADGVAGSVRPDDGRATGPDGAVATTGFEDEVVAGVDSGAVVGTGMVAEAERVGWCAADAGAFMAVTGAEILAVAPGRAAGAAPTGPVA